MPEISIDQIDIPPDYIRTVAPSAAQTAELEASILFRGVDVALIARPVGNRYVLRDGARRLNAARAVGLATVPVDVRELASASDDAAAQATANMLRAPLHPVDQWHAVVAMTDQGMTLRQAAETLGLSEGAARRIERLAKLHPDVIAAIVAHGLPGDAELATIAMAPQEIQAAAIARHPGDNWHAIATACRTSRISAKVALFDVATSGLVFEVDLFAQPGSDEAEYTTDVAGFLKAQDTALTLEIMAQKKRNMKVERGGWKKGAIELPKEWEAAFVGTSGKPKGTTLFRAVQETGFGIGTIVEQYASPKAAPAAKRKPAAEAEAGTTTATTTAAGEAPAEDGTPPPPPAATPPAVREPVTAAGRVILAGLKTAALAEATNLLPLGEDPREAIAALLLALHAANVTVRAAHGAGTLHDAGLIERLIEPGGGLRIDNLEELLAIAGEALGRVLAIDKPGAERAAVRVTSGPVAEWIGAMLGAEKFLPRMDTEEIIATVPADVLRQAAEAAGMTSLPKSAAELRKRCIGALPDFRPPGAGFALPGATAPAPETGTPPASDTEAA